MSKLKDILDSHKTNMKRASTSLVDLKNQSSDMLFEHLKDIGQQYKSFFNQIVPFILWPIDQCEKPNTKNQINIKTALLSPSIHIEAENFAFILSFSYKEEEEEKKDFNFLEIFKGSKILSCFLFCFLFRCFQFFVFLF